MTSTPAPKVTHLFGPATDLLLLGGASVLASALLRLWSPSHDELATLAVVMLFAANFVNHPHFAHSYQLFYGAWPDVREGAMPLALRRRWWFAGMAAPLLLIVLLGLGAWHWVQGRGALLGVSLNLMGALVGWHYVKQGFGMAMMDAALKKRFWAPQARRALLFNAYACWAWAWAWINMGSLGKAYWGIVGLPTPIPEAVVIGLGAVAAVTTAWAGVESARSLKAWRAADPNWRHWPLAGWVAYVITLYLWTVFAGIHPAFALVIPFFHSLQYLGVVWRFRLNELAGSADGKRRFSRFLWQGFVLGALGFWLVPMALDLWRSGALPRMSGGNAALAMACFWIFINVHHYLIDNVIWRQGNPRVSRHLFGAPQAAGQR